MKLFMWVMVLILPGIIFAMGLVFKLKPPKKINMIYGFRTERSMASQQAWDEAHRMGGQMWTVAGIVLIVLAVFAMLVFTPDSPAVLFGVYGASFVGIFVPLGIIQRRLKEKFGK